jgi:alkylation response protein AidB-like acyl-CoA dehydrogenase
MLGGIHQLKLYGTEEQKERWMPDIANGELGAVAITEPFVGSDAAATETTAVRNGDEYIITGKKRFTTDAGTADRYMIYAKTSSDPEDKKTYRHLTGFIIKKGMPGFSLEKINELIGFDATPNGSLSMDEMHVPVENMVGEEGEGWMLMMSGLNYERTIGSSMSGGALKECLRYPLWYMKRRVQFGSRTIDIPTNQFKIADIIARLKLIRLSIYYTAHLIDLGYEPMVDSAVLKLFATDFTMQSAIDAVQLMGGDALTKFYPVERIMRDDKIYQIAMGTNEIMKMIIYRAGVMEMKEDLEIKHKLMINDELGVPIPTVISEKSKVDEDGMLKILADDYRCNPGLHMSKDDIKDEVEITDEELDKMLLSLEKKNLVNLYRDKKNRIRLAKATYTGLGKAYPKEYYRWFPKWYKEEDKF